MMTSLISTVGASLLAKVINDARPFAPAEVAQALYPGGLTTHHVPPVATSKVPGICGYKGTDVERTHFVHAPGARGGSYAGWCTPG